MEVRRISFITLVLLGSIVTTSDRRIAGAEGDLPNRAVTQDPPVADTARFIPFRSLERRLEIREEETLIVGEIAADCAPGVASNFLVISPDKPFVTLIDDSCSTVGKFRWLIRLAPQRGDAGKYRVTICGSACLFGHCYTFDIKVNAAL